MKPHVRTTTVARVKVTLEVEVGSWGPSCDLSQVYRQASEEATNKLRRLTTGGHGVRVIGVVSVQALTTNMEAS